MDFKNKVILAPMAGITDMVFRNICKENGADIVVSEMISAEGIAHNAAATGDLAVFSDSERPVGIQLFGSNPGRLAAAAEYVQDKFSPDFIDLNSGCPVRKVVAGNGGSALLKEPKLFKKILSEMKMAITVPLTVKIRSGWSKNEWVDVEFGKIAEDCGVSAIALHPRSKTMGFSGHSFWERIREIKRAVSIPVIGNGDIFTPADAQRMVNETGCDSIMIGRGCYGNPWFLGQCGNLLNGKPVLSVTKEMKFKTAMDHLKRYREHYGERRASSEMKKHAAWYIKGLPGASVTRNILFRAGSTDELRGILTDFFSKNI